MDKHVKKKVAQKFRSTDIDKYRVAANITEYHIISLLTKIRQLFHIKNIGKIKILKF